MPDNDDFELPADWVAQGWTKETALKPDQDHSQAWGDASADLTPADPSTAVAQSDSASSDTQTSTS
jgi:hypothetical protein